jgi:hypothetical protein
MITWQNLTWRAAVIGRWTALIFGTLMVLFFLAFFFGEGPPHLSNLTAADKLQFAALGVLLLGLILAWKWEGAGGLLALAGFVTFVAINSSHLKLSLFDVPGAIAVIHIACWWRLHAGPPAGPPDALTPWHVSPGILVGLGAVLGLFILLCANEMFGQPPLMTPSLHPAANLQGAWTQNGPNDVAFIIHEDGSVTGTVDGAGIADARVTYGRSWFGRLLHWNADYVIRGRAAGQDFTAPLMIARRGLDGSLFRNHRPVRLHLRKL